MASRTVTVAELMTRAREMADMTRTNFVSDQELVRYISNEYTDMYDMLVTRYSNYYVSPTPYIITQTGVEAYALPTNFYKLMLAEYSAGGSQDWVTMYPYQFTEKNSVAAFNMLSQRYAIVGDEIMFSGGSYNKTIRLWYVPAPPVLDQKKIITAIDPGTGTITIPGSDLAVGDFLYFNGVHLPTGVIPGARYYVVGSPTADNFQVSLIEDDVPVTFTDAGSGVLKADWYGRGQVIDGVSGWDEYVVVCCAIRMLTKEESDTKQLQMRKAELKDRIQAAAQNRDDGNAPTCTDVRGTYQENEMPWLFRG